MTTSARPKTRPSSKRRSRRRTCRRRLKCTPAPRMAGALRTRKFITSPRPKRHGRGCWRCTEKLWPEHRGRPPGSGMRDAEIIETELMEISAIADDTIKFERIVAWCASHPDEIPFALHQLMGRPEKKSSEQA